MVKNNQTKDGGTTMKVPLKIIKLFVPFIYIWLCICLCIMKIGRGIDWFGNMLSKFKLDPYNWTQEI